MYCASLAAFAYAYCLGRVGYFSRASEMAVEASNGHSPYAAEDVWPVMQLLVTALRNHFQPEVAPIGAPSTFLMQQAIAMAFRNKVGWHVQNSLGAPEFVHLFSGNNAAVALHNDILLRSSLEVKEVLDEIDCKYIFVKGPFQQAIVHGSYSVRYSSDLDILVRRRDFTRVRKRIEELGFSLLSRSVWWWAFLGEQHLVRNGPRRLAIDLHHQLHQPGVPGLKFLGQIFDRAHMWAWQGNTLPILAREDVPLLLALSICKALLSRDTSTGYITDLFVLLMADVRNSVNQLLTTAARQGLTGHVRVALRLVDVVYGSDFLPEEPKKPLATVSDETLLAMIMVPDAHFIDWPRRHILIASFCDEHPISTIKELALAYTAELAMRLFERGERIAQ